MDTRSDMKKLADLIVEEFGPERDAAKDEFDFQYGRIEDEYRDKIGSSQGPDRARLEEERDIRLNEVENTWLKAKEGIDAKMELRWNELYGKDKQI